MPATFTLLAQAAAADPGHEPLQLFGTRLIGITPDNGRKVAITAAFLAAMAALGWVLRAAARPLFRQHRGAQVTFWARQGINLALSLLALVGVTSIWFDNPTRLATFVGLVTAGVAFALQKPISALAGYLVILRGKTFGVGDRITMGGVRGDVVALGFTQTTIMEMGQPPGVQGADPAMWVHSRQYTGRVVTVSNAKVFDEPVYNYTRDFPYVWEEMAVPIAYTDDRDAAERVLLAAADRHTVAIRDVGQVALDALQRRYLMAPAELAPRVYWRLTDNWVELTVRFLAQTHGVRDLKDAMARDVLRGLDAAKVGIASGTYQVVGMPPLRVQIEPPTAAPAGDKVS